MKEISAKKRVCLMAAALGLIAVASVTPALSYFTTYAAAKGGYAVELSYSTKLHEDFVKWTKLITVENTGDAACYVRVSAFAGSNYALQYTPGDTWYDGGDGYWYYRPILDAKGTTDTLNISIDHVNATEAQSFNVVVIEEASPVLYTADGTPYANWAGKLLDANSNTYAIS